MDSKLNILFICNKSPWPPREGGPIAMNNLIEGLVNAGHKVKVLAINTNKYNFDPASIPEPYKKRTGIELVYVDLSIKPIEAFFNLFTGKSYHVERFISDDFRNKLIEVLSKDSFDIVQIETLFMSPYIEVIRSISNARIILRAHNIEHLIWKRVASITKNPFKKWYLNHLAKTLERYEKEIIKSYDGIVPISDSDSEFFKLNNTFSKITTISFGVDISEYAYSNHDKVENAVFHIGAMNWIPNEEGIKWFLDNVWCEIIREIPNLKLYLAGREMPEWLAKLNMKNVVVLGEVPSAKDFMRSYSISIAPLFSGSGIRIKLIESMALGRAVISTKIGAEGINYTHGKNILIADDAKQTITAIKLLYNDTELRNEIGEKARNLIEEEHHIQILIERLVKFYRSLLG